jgi:tetratricopeptide (TPR) repeat protein
VIELLLQAERALSVGLLDRAETLYRQVAAADPRNSIAVVGLARVAIERGDELEALALGRRALEIDPENSAAQRLVQRLEEVRAYRGEPPVSVAAPPAPEPVRETAPRPEPMPVPGPAPESQQAPAPAAGTPPLVAPVEAPRRTRSWLDRVLRRNR